ncbi:MAG: type VI secretion system contractile sheath large subunit [Pseudomonadota bacterium]
MTDDPQKPPVAVTSQFGFSGPKPARPAPKGGRLLVLGALGGGQFRHISASDAAALDAAPGAFGVAVDLVVENGLGPGATHHQGRLTLERLRDCAPARLLAQLPLIAKTHAALEAAGTGKPLPAGDTLGLETLLAALTNQPPSATTGSSVDTPSPAAPSAASPTSGPSASETSGDSTGDDPLDRLFGMIDAGPDSTASHPAAPAPSPPEQDLAKKAVSSFISEITRTTPKSLTERKDVSAARALLSAETARLMDVADVARLVETWQGIALIAEATDFRNDMRIDLVDTGSLAPEEALARPELDALIDQTDGPPLAAILLTDRFTATDMGWKALSAIARLADRAQVPAIASFSDDLLGTVDATEIAKRDGLGDAVSGPGFEGLEGLRGQEEARWLSLAFNSVLAREAIDPWPAAWCPPALATGALIAQAIAGGGWAASFSGVRGALGGHPLHTLKASGRDMAVPTRYVLTADQCRSLADAGILAIMSRPDRDQIFVLETPSVLRPSRHPDDQDGRDGRRLVSFAYQLAVSRTVQHLSRLLGEIDRGRPPQAVAADLQDGLLDLAATSGGGAGVSVEVDPDPDRVDGSILSISVRLGADVLDRAQIDLAIPT